jgi:hypothetical protein
MDVYIYVCIYVCMYICMCGCMCGGMYVYVCVYICMCKVYIVVAYLVAYIELVPRTLAEDSGVYVYIRVYTVYTNKFVYLY